MKYLELRFRSIVFLSIVALATIINACDDIKEDVEPIVELNNAAELDIPVGERSPVVIDLLQKANISEKAQISIVKKPGKGTAEILAPSLLQYIPNDSFTEGKDILTYQVCINGNCNEGNIEFIQSNDDDCNFGARYDVSSGVQGTQQIVVDVLINDQLCNDDIDVTSLAIVSGPSNGEAVVNNGLLFYYPNYTFIGTEKIMYSIQGKGTSAIPSYALVQITITEATGCQFQAMDDGLTYTVSYMEQAMENGGLLIEQRTYTINDEFCNIPENSLNITSHGQPTEGSVEFFNLEGLKYYLPEVMAGDYSFSYQVCDVQQENCSVATITITITDDNPCQIVTQDDSYTYGQADFDGLLSRGFILYAWNELFANDNLCDISYFDFNVSISQNPTHGTIQTFYGEGFGYTPTESFAGEDSFSYQLCYQNECVEGTVSITVN